MLENCYVALLFVPNVTRKWCRLKYGWISPCHFYGFFSDCGPVSYFSDWNQLCLDNI